jgi:hypothetical protein
MAYPNEYGRDRGGVIAGSSGEGSCREGFEDVRECCSDGVEGSGVEQRVVAGGLDVSHSYGARSQGQQDGSSWDAYKGSIVQSGVGGAWDIESRVFPVAYGFPRAMGKRGLSRDEIESLGYETHVRDQLKGFGNAILPQIAEIVWGMVGKAEEWCG